MFALISKLICLNNWRLRFFGLQYRLLGNSHLYYFRTVLQNCFHDVRSHSTSSLLSCSLFTRKLRFDVTTP